MFDVVIPAHNAAATIEGAVGSVREQSRPANEIIVVADACSDDTSSLARAAGAHVIEIDARSAGAARNAGILAASAPYVAFLDADDLWRPGWLEAVQQAFDRVPAASLAYGDFIEESPEGDLLWVSPEAVLVGDVFEALLARNFMATSACVCARASLLRVGLFEPTLANSQDWDLWLRLSAGAPAVAVPGHHMRYRRVEGSVSRSPDRLLVARDDALRVVERACALRAVSPSLRRRAMASVLAFSAMRLLTRGATRAARTDLNSALAHTPRDLSLWLMAVLSATPPEVRRAALAARRGWHLSRSRVARASARSWFQPAQR